MARGGWETGESSGRRGSGAAWIEGPPDLGSPGSTTRRGGRKAIRKIYDIADGPHRVIGLIDAHGVNLAGES
ncbi:hypothetical protein ACWDBO_23990 [Streptomyces mirabilis]|uniref:hypothetical protein n=1 Tax=Streptomyces mirabilis TaxID=68239 RepID=UPI00331F3ADC